MTITLGEGSVIRSHCSNHRDGKGQPTPHYFTGWSLICCSCRNNYLPEIFWKWLEEKGLDRNDPERVWQGLLEFYDVPQEK